MYAQSSARASDKHIIVLVRLHHFAENARRARLDEVVPECVRDRLGLAVDAKFFQNVLDVVAHRDGGDEKAPGDLAGRMTSGEHGKCLDLPLREWFET